MNENTESIFEALLHLPLKTLALIGTFVTFGPQALASLVGNEELANQMYENREALLDYIFNRISSEY